MAKSNLIATSKEVEDLFLTAAEKGDKRAILVALDHCDVFDVNCKDVDGQSALLIAIVNGHFDLVETLSSHPSVDLGDSLLRAVNLQFVPAVWAICKSMKVRDMLPGGLNCRSLNSDFHPDITPMVLAGHYNNYEILKILIDHGATIDDPEEYEFFTEEFTMEHSVGKINVYRALCSEAVIGLTRADPVRRAFDLSHQMRKLSIRNFEFRFQFEELATSCEDFAAALLNHVRNSKEQITVLTHDPEEWSRDGFRGDYKEPYKVKAAIECSQKKFVAHPHCQQRLAECWYHGLTGWRSHSTWKSMLYSALMMVSFPILSLCFIVAPKKYPGSLLTIPYVRFLCNVMSQFIFLVCLIVHFVDISQFDVSDTKDVDSEEDGTVIKGNLTPTWLEIFIIIFVIAMTWHELCQLHRKGRSSFRGELQTNLFDIVTLCLYWGWIVIRIIAAMQVVMYSAQQHHSQPLNETANETAPGFAVSGNNLLPLPEVVHSSAADNSTYEFESSLDSIYTLRDINAKLDDMFERQDEMYNTLAELIGEKEEDQTPPEIENVETKYNSDTDVTESRVRRATRSRGAGKTKGKSRQRTQGTSVIANLVATHPLLLAEGLLSLAKVFSVLRLVRVTVVHLHIGPMQISFARMGGDILKFSAIFSLILLAFSVGMSELYHLYTEDYQSDCRSRDELRCKIPYKDLQTALSTLFWTLFGMTDLRSVEVTVANHWITELVGYFLFAVYHIIAIVALLNILIAMMSNTYTRIEEDADIQWKFSRSNLWISYYEEDASLYPPFNLIPTMTDFRSFYFHLTKSCKAEALDDKRRKKDVRIHSMDAEYKDLMKELIQRYFFATSTCDDPGKGFQSWMLQIKEDVSNFRFETFEAFGYINKTVTSLKNTVEGTEEGNGEEEKMEAAKLAVGDQFLRNMAAAVGRAEEVRLPVRPAVFKGRQGSKLKRLGSVDIPFIDERRHGKERKDSEEDEFNIIEMKPKGKHGKGTNI
ncbi:transient receptor potential-gamma protein-like [Ptychodera flava]|uniref:transient receptor potential-gamma protein-like n=1 Tax=Ptychodera flava TaxID=63121 RepID=UPI00396A85ED